MDAKPLRLLAEDEADLTLLSAAAQDALFTVADAVWLPKARRFSLKLQRYRWEAVVDADADVDAGRRTGADAGAGQRVWSVLSFESVLGVRAHKIAQSRRNAFASLLSIQFTKAAEPPGGTLTLTLADGGAIALDVECLDLSLTDLSPPRPALNRPDHG